MRDLAWKPTAVADLMAIVDYISDDNPAAALGGTSVTMHLQVDEADAVIRRAAEAGAEIETEPEDQFYGERSGWFRDPSGHRRNIGHFLEEITPEEMQRRFTAMMTGTDR